MKITDVINRVMEYSKERGVDINLSCIKMSHEIRNGDIGDITAEELTAAHKFIKVHYDTIVAARKGDGEAQAKLEELTAEN